MASKRSCDSNDPTVATPLRVASPLKLRRCHALWRERERDREGRRDFREGGKGAWAGCMEKRETGGAGWGDGRLADMLKMDFGCVSKWTTARTRQHELCWMFNKLTSLAREKNPTKTTVNHKPSAKVDKEDSRRQEHQSEGRD
ncbi:unnamed protein product [Prunus armeniaca]|uniref:Uncharacterized protein n=1 Tax=Prunus armeniaca TaxID=36596 RepID=A0A6J5TES5_PRUAR|nr:unnamed protein product [Prunus armeniaca]